MGHLERTLKWLRPVIMGSERWDYGVVWKIKKEASRSSLEWAGCCCVGGQEENPKILCVKEERERTLYPFCRDSQILHVAKTKACEALSKLPFSILLCSGIHGEVIASAEPSWTNITYPSDSGIADESLGTRVLIPVLGGLVELFAREHMPKDEDVINFFMAQFHVSSPMETITVQSCTQMSFTEHSRFLTPSDHYQIVFGEQAHLLDSAVVCSNNHLNYEGSPTSSFPADKLEQKSFALPSEEADVKEKKNKERGKSKNLFAERNRRNKIRKVLFELRASVPNITQMSRAAIVGDAIDYIQELEGTAKKLRDELQELSKEDRDEKSHSELQISELRTTGKTADNKRGTSWDGDGKLSETPPSIEVNQLSSRDFLLKVLYEQKHGSFSKLIKDLDSMGLQVIDVSVTSCNGMVLNMLNLQANRNEIQAKDVRDTLVESLLPQHFG